MDGKGEGERRDETNKWNGRRVPRMNPTAPLMKSMMEPRMFWKRWKIDWRVEMKRLKTDWKAERMVLKMPAMIS